MWRSLRAEAANHGASACGRTPEGVWKGHGPDGPPKPPDRGPPGSAATHRSQGRHALIDSFENPYTEMTRSRAPMPVADVDRSWIARSSGIDVGP